MPEPDEKTNWFNSLAVKGDFSPATLDTYFATVQKWLQSDMAFLRRPIGVWRGASGWTRGLAFAAVAAGVIFPLPIFGPMHGGPSGLALGYFSVLLGGLILLLDRVFDISNSWMRLTLAEMQMKQVRYRLDLEWAKQRPLLTADNGSVEGPALIDILRSATDSGHEIMQAQKVAWTNELKQGMEALRGRLDDDRIALERLRAQQQQEAARPRTGALNLTLDKPTELKAPLRLKVAGQVRLDLDHVPARLSVNDVPAGLQTISLEAPRAAAGGQPFTFMVTEPIVAGEVKAIAVAVA